MNDEEQLRHRLGGIDFGDEPPASMLAAGYAELGARRVRRRRATAWGGGLVGVAAAATGIALVLPPATGTPELEPAGAGVVAPATTPAEPSDQSTTVPDPAGARGEGTSTTPADEQALPYPRTRQLLLDLAVTHLDPGRDHLPAESDNAQGDGPPGERFVATKLSWAVPGSDGLGMVQVGVSAPGVGEFTTEDVAMMLGCDEAGACAEQPVPGTDETVLVSGPSEETTREFGVMYERADGSYVGIVVQRLFGNNSLVPVPSVDITLEQAIAFVTDTALQLHPDEAAAAPQSTGD